MAQTGMTASGTTIRNALRTLPRITTAFARPDGRRLHVRNTALPNADPAAIDPAMPIAPPARTPARRRSSETIRDRAARRAQYSRNSSLVCHHIF